MRRRVYLVVVGAAGAGGAVRAMLRRLRRGPTLPSWTWSEEIFVGVSRATARAGARHVALMTPTGRGLQPRLSRAARAALVVEDVELAGVRAERYCPTEPPRGTILWLHGGGFVAGSVGLERRVAAIRAMTSRCDTYSLDYRLAPRHPFPAAIDDAVAAYRALLGQGVDPATTILSGGSAGAGLALSTMLRLRELGLPQPAGAVLLWPYADFTFSGETIERNAEVDMLPVSDLSSRWGPAYVGSADPADPLVSPALADLTGLPPLFVLAGGAESLLSCAERIAGNAERDGVDVQLRVFPEKVHGWLVLSKLPASVEAIAEIDAWIDERLHAT